jgi:amino acid adenylation domain-containing protein
LSHFLSKEKRQLLAQVLQSRESRQLLTQASARPRAGRVVIERRSDPAAPSPLSFAQQRFWLLHQLDPAKGHCNMPVAFRLTGGLKAAALVQTLRKVVSRHESLRTVFPVRDGEVMQVVRARAGLDFSQCDLSSVEAAEREKVAEAILHEEAVRPFDIAAEPCARFRLLRLSETTHWLLLVAHHIAFDTWSLGVFIREVAAGYEAACHGRPFPLPDLDAQYADWACWEQKAAAEGRFAEQLSYWEKRLRGAPELLTLPLDRPRVPFDGARGRSEAFGWGRTVAEGVTALGNAERASVFMVLLAALSVLLKRYGCGRDITIGSAFGNRPSHDAEVMIGCFMNTLIFRTRISGDPSFRQLLRQVRDESLAAYEHSAAPFQQVVAALNPKRHPSYSPYSQVMLIVQNAELPSLVGPGIGLARMPVPERFTPQQDLTFHVRAVEGGLRGVADYNSDIFEASTARRLLRHFEQLLDAAVQEPDCPISRLTFLSPPELLRLTGRGDDEARATTNAPEPIHLEFERQAARTPDRVAFGCGDEQLTYSELNRRANALAWRLRELDAGLEQPVAVCLTEPAARLVGMLAVLKAGAAYMPLDPSMPGVRLRAALRGAGPFVLLTEARVAAALDLRKGHNVCLYAERSEPAGRRTSNPRVPLHVDNLACVLHTSGATGVPKPAMLTHRALASAVRSLGSTIGFESGEALGVLATPPSDRHSVEMLVALAAGGRVEVFSGREAEDGRLLRRAVEASAVTVLQATPPVWRRLLDSGWSSPRGFKLLCWGETLPPDLADDLLAGGVTLWNLYGAAETAFVAAAGQLGRGEPVTFGAPVSHARAYVLDESLHPAPAGVAGEFYLGGAALGRGYLNRPGLTAERFVPNPLAFDPGSRLWSTGDVASFSPAGPLRFMYRSEPQTMMQGFRVMFGAIEYALCRHPAVSRALVLPHGAPPEQKGVTAYVVPRRADGSAGGELSLDAFREFLRMQLPDHSMPSAVYLVDDLPQGLCGKTSRKALPRPEPAAEGWHRAPESETERVVSRAWARVLGVERVGLDDDFFALGGDSLKAQRALVEVERELGVSIVTAGAPFANPTVAQLSEHIDKAKRAGMFEEEEQLANVV